MIYAPLNIKTDYSLLNSMIKISDLILFAKENKIPALTITDDNMCGVIEFYEACTQNHIKPIIGLDIKIDNYHILLYARNFEGYQNLLKLSDKSSEDQITLLDLKQYSKNLICILPYASLSLESHLNFYDLYYIGYQTQEEYVKIDPSKRIYCNPIHYLKKQDESYFKYLKAISNNYKIENESYSEKFLKLENQLSFDLTNNYEFTKLCNFEFDYQTRRIPKFPCPNHLDSFSYLKQLCKEGMKRIFGDKVPIQYLERLKYELSVIHEMNFCDYFLIVHDYVEFAKKNHILVGPGRGSSAGSLVSYCLDIIEVDPLKYQLLFERFLNKDRITLPDIDIDFEGTRREEVIDYCKQKYGMKHVASIITFSSLTSKQVLKDVGRVLNISNEMVDYFARMFKAKVSLMDNYRESDRIQNHLNRNPELKKLFDISLKLENLKKHISQHASGVVISDCELDEVVPLVYYNNEYLIGYTMGFLEQLGLIKMDFLSLKTLTTIDHMLKEIPEFNASSIPLNDMETLEIFKKGQTMGIFQFESAGMIQFLKKIQPQNFEELYNIIALYRPGPMGNINSYIRRRNRLEPVDYFHPDLIPILKSTYGIIIYQEQIMQIAVTLAGYSLGEADLLRRAMSKKKERILIQEKDKFIERAALKGYDLSLVQKIYELILKFAEYGFPKAHAVAYSLISYRMAYIKAHYPNIFMKNMLNSVIGSDIDTRDYIVECHDLDIPILNPNIQFSGSSYEITNQGILFPLLAIKNVGIVVVNHIIDERKKGPFLDFYDFLKRTNHQILSRSVLQNLIYSGAFDCFSLTRRTMIENLDVALNYIELLGDLSEEYVMKPEIEEYEEYSKNEKLYLEKQALGFYLNNHPVNEYRKKYHKLISISSISNYLNKTIDLIVSIDSIHESRSKKGEPICFMRVSDELLQLETPIFAEAYKNTPPLALNDIVQLTGRVSRRNGKDQLIVNKVIVLEHVDQSNLLD